jgi:DNA helicase-2/ATP-dependent DNA helicase PcrA
MLEEGSLPIRQALDDDEALEEERRLLYVGITRARTHLSLSWAEQRESRGRDARRRPSRFLEAIAPHRRASGGGPRPHPRRVIELGDAFTTPGGGDAESVALFDRLRAWRTRRAKEDGMAAYIVAHDSTLRAIAEARPASLAALRRVPGMGPVKLERYGAEILAALGDGGIGPT